MKKIIYSLVLFSFIFVGKIKAQGDYVSLQYVMSFGSGDLSDYISNPSFRGGVIDYHRQINTNMTLQ